MPGPRLAGPGRAFTSGLTVVVDYSPATEEGATAEALPAEDDLPSALRTLGE